MGRNELKMHYLKFHELTIDRWIDRLVFKGTSTSMVIGTPDIQFQEQIIHPGNYSG
jgi:hypothetical protein